MLKGKPASSHELTREPESAGLSDNRAAFLRFITADGREFGFPYAQLLEFVLDSNLDTGAPQRLLLAFPSHDVTVTGFRLHLLCEQLDQHNAVRLKAEDSRFANLHPLQPFVVGISITTTATP
jgi:hypothetical protein